jgi:hypothetical protein
MIGHLIFEPVRVFFIGLGGLTRWCFFQFLNVTIEEKYPKNVDYYTNNKSEKIDRNGFTTVQKNMFVAFALIICTLILIDKLEQ